MDTFNNFKRIGTILFIVGIVCSCSTTKKAAVACPELPGYYKNYKAAVNLNKQNKKFLAASKKRNATRYSVNNHRPAISRSPGNGIKSLNEGFKQAKTNDLHQMEKIEAVNNIEYNNLIASVDNSIIPIINTDLYSNSDKVAEVDLNTVRVKKNSTTLIQQNSNQQEVLNSRTDAIKNNISISETKVIQQDYPPRIEGLGLAGFVASIVGLIIAGIPLGIIAIVFGLVSLGKIRRQPERFTGRGFAIASFVIGIVDIVGAIIVLALIANETI